MTCNLHGAGLVALAIALSAAASASAAAAPALKADIVRTRYGVAHVTASDFAGLGFGSAYAFAEDNVCLLADQVVTVSGERSKYFGAGGTTSVAFADVKNLDSDLFFKATLDGDALREASKAASPDYRAMIHGYVEGYNAYLRKTGVANLPAACRGAAWVRPLTDEDLLKVMEEKMTQAGAGAWLSAIVNAAPPGPSTSAKPPAKSARFDLPLALPPLAGGSDVGLGSNGWAFGADATGGPGVLLGNPHFPWTTTNRFYQIHLTLPGRLDVMGATLSGLPGVSIGFNRDVAWTHTVSTDRHFTLFDLTLDPADPTAYVVDGRKLPMTRRSVTVEVKDGPPVTRTLYASIYGPVAVQPFAGLTWTPAHAYAVKDANRLNLRAGDAWLGIARARSVAEIKAAIGAGVGIPWVNTIAADRSGQALYADVTATPNLSAAKLADCAPKSPTIAMLAARRVYVLDGARSACDWTVDPTAPVPGLTPASAMPSTVRRDFVANSNDSFWLANDTAPLTGFSPIIGLGPEPQNLRTRIGLIEIHQRLAQAARPGPAITPEAVKAMLFADRVYGAEMTLDDILPLCRQAPQSAVVDGKTVDFARACDILGRWDRKMAVDSVGAAIFVELWRLLGRDETIFARAFDPRDPVNTPSGVKSDPAAAQKVRLALAKAVALMAERGEPLDAPWGRVQSAVRGDDRIPLHGGPGSEDGVLNAQQSRWVPGVGYLPFHGSSYIQVVTFNAEGPVAEGVLTYSQSTDPASPHFADQTWLYSRGQWNALPFSPSEIQAAKISSEHVER